ncbi:MAG: aminopeptidase P family protein [Actinomycetota bacterium]|nr:aminopeptidase P family protein [Actinomycetota bacterium]
MAPTDTGHPHPLADLPPMDTATRLGRLQAVLERDSLGALVVTNLTNVRYLTGFTGSAGVLVVTAAAATLVTDGRYRIQGVREIGAWGSPVDLAIAASAGEQTDKVSKLAGLRGRIGLEDHGAWEQSERIRSALKDGAPSGVEMVSGLVENLRMEKDGGEVARIEAAASVADRALAVVLARLAALPGTSRSSRAPDLQLTDQPEVVTDEQEVVAANVVSALLGGSPVTEAAVALALDTAMRCLGASASAFETIVASGPRGAQPHARPTREPVEPGELIVIDFGAVVEGYRSDMTRTVCLGPPKRELARKMVDVVAEAQAAGVAAVSEDSDGASVDKACREVIAAAGWADAFTHGTGHGVGLDIHEAPWVGKSCTAKLPHRSVVTVEPGVYLEGVGGVRIEDTVVVDGPGCRTLTNAPKELVV